MEFLCRNIIYWIFSKHFSPVVLLSSFVTRLVLKHDCSPCFSSIITLLYPSQPNNHLAHLYPFVPKLYPFVPNCTQLSQSSHIMCPYLHTLYCSPFTPKLWISLPFCTHLYPIIPKFLHNVSISLYLVLQPFGHNPKTLWIYLPFVPICTQLSQISYIMCLRFIPCIAALWSQPLTGIHLGTEDNPESNPGSVPTQAGRQLRSKGE